MGKDPVVDIPKARYGKHILPVPSPFAINIDILLEQGWNSGGSSGGLPLFLDQTEAEGPKKVFETAPPPLYLRVRMTGPLLCEYLDLPPWNSKQVKHQTEASS